MKVDDSDKSPGWKFSEQEMRGIPVRIEIGPKDIEAGNGRDLSRRDTSEKIESRIDELAEKVAEVLETMQKRYAGEVQESTEIPIPMTQS